MLHRPHNHDSHDQNPPHHPELEQENARLRQDIVYFEKLVAGHDEEMNAMASEVDLVAGEIETCRAQVVKALGKVTEKEIALAKLTAQVAKSEQTNALTFDELASVRLQVVTLTALQKQQKGHVESLQVGHTYIFNHETRESIESNRCPSIVYRYRYIDVDTSMVARAFL